MSAQSDTPRTDARIKAHPSTSSIGQLAESYNDLLDHARDLERELAALRAAPQGEWQWVPKEVTVEMRTAGANAADIHSFSPVAVYHAMLSSAPSRPEVHGWAVKDGSGVIQYIDLEKNMDELQEEWRKEIEYDGYTCVEVTITERSGG